MALGIRVNLLLRWILQAWNKALAPLHNIKQKVEFLRQEIEGGIKWLRVVNILG